MHKLCTKWLRGWLRVLWGIVKGSNILLHFQERRSGAYRAGLHLHFLRVYHFDYTFSQIATLRHANSGASSQGKTQVCSLYRQITLRIMGYHFSSRLTATLNLCLIYLKLLLHMSNSMASAICDFEVNQTKLYPMILRVICL